MASLASTWGHFSSIAIQEDASSGCKELWEFLQRNEHPLGSEDQQKERWKGHTQPLKGTTEGTVSETGKKEAPAHTTQGI